MERDVDGPGSAGAEADLDPTAGSGSSRAGPCGRSRRGAPGDGRRPARVRAGCRRRPVPPGPRGGRPPRPGRGGAASRPGSRPGRPGGRGRRTGAPRTPSRAPSRRTRSGSGGRARRRSGRPPRSRRSAGRTSRPGRRRHPAPPQQPETTAQEASGSGMRPVAGPTRKRCGPLQTLGGLARVVLGSSHEITSRSFAESGGQNMTERHEYLQGPHEVGKLDARNWDCARVRAGKSPARVLLRTGSDRRWGRPRAGPRSRPCPARPRLRLRSKLSDATPNSNKKI